MPNAKPYLLKMAEGNRGRRDLKPPVHAGRGDFDSPLELPPDAVSEWNRIRAEAPWITASEAGMLAMRCLAWAQWLQMERDVQKEGYVLETRNGAVKNAKVGFAREYRAAVMKCDVELGLTTLSRERITQESAGVGNPEDAAMFA